jgi:hypothetical protein
MQTEVAQDSYGAAVIDLARTGAAVRYAGDYLIALGQDRPTVYYEATGRPRPARTGPFSTVQFDVAVADAGDGRFVPMLKVHLPPRGSRHRPPLLRSGRPAVPQRRGMPYTPGVRSRQE